MTSIESVTVETNDATEAERLYVDALGLGDRVRVRESEAPTTGFRGFTLSLVVSGPATADAFIAAALGAGAVTLKPAKKSMWGYGGTVQAPDGTIVTVASSTKKDSGPATRRIDDLVLQLGVTEVLGSKRFYVDHGLTVSRSYGRRYVEFGTGPITLALLKRPALAKTAGVSPEGSGSHRIAIGSRLGSFTDPDGFVWEENVVS